MCLTIDSPNPVPPEFRLRSASILKKRSVSLGINFSSIPIPESCTSKKGF